MPWTRRTWMPLAAASGMMSMAVAALAMLLIRDARTAELLKIGATFQFMHSMASFACVTFMQVGGRPARHGPAFFLGGIGLFSFPLYALAAGAPGWLWGIPPLGGMGFLAGWALLFMAGREVDGGAPSKRGANPARGVEALPPGHRAADRPSAPAGRPATVEA